MEGEVTSGAAPRVEIWSITPCHGRADLTRARHRMGKFLLRRHCHFTGSKCAWGTRHRAWLHVLRFEQPADQMRTRPPARARATTYSSSMRSA